MTLAAISVIQLFSIVLLVILFLLGFKLVESGWSYKISKPYRWEEEVRKGNVSRKVKKIERFYRDKVRFYSFWFQLERLKHAGVEGAFAEVGVYKGETANMIHALDPSRKLYLFDTFTGFDKGDISHEPDQGLTAVDFTDTSVEAVMRRINGNENVKFFPGHFPETTAELPEEKYALVHLDADLYHPTIEGLRYFYPRLSPGGAIVIHDYNHNWQGLRKAVDEFVRTIPETLTYLADWQGSVMIIKNQR